MSVQVKSTGRQTMDFPSDTSVQVDLPAVAADTALPDVVVSGIPTGAVLDRVVPWFKCRAIRNTNVGGTNGLIGDQVIQVKKAGGAWVTAIDLKDNQWLLAASANEAGDVLKGDNDLKATVDGDGTYNFQFASALVDLAVLRLNGVLVGLTFFFKTS